MRRLALALFVVAACSNKTPEPKNEPSPAPTTPLPAASAPAAGVAKAAGPRVEGKGFVVEVAAPEAAAAGAAHAAQVVLTPTTGYHVNKEFPTSLKLAIPAGASCDKPDQKGKDAAKLEEAGARFDVSCTATAAGTLAYQAVFKFAVCTETTCDPKNEKLAWNVQVK